MSLTLMYITNRPDVAEIAQNAGVDRIWIDMEYIGKEARQGGMDTVKSHHTIEDIRRLRPIVTTSQLMVRVNPIHDQTEEYGSSEEEIRQTVEAGADVIMLPMFKEKSEVERFIAAVDGKAKTQLLFETAEAVENIEEILSVPGIDEVHIGLNDLHLAYHRTFMFELLSDGTVERLCGIFRKYNLKYGFGGIARVGYGDLPAEMIMTEHYRLGSTAAILSRGFCNANMTPDAKDIETTFVHGVKDIRAKEREIEAYAEEAFDKNRAEVSKRVLEIVKRKIN